MQVGDKLYLFNDRFNSIITYYVTYIDDKVFKYTRHKDSDLSELCNISDNPFSLTKYNAIQTVIDSYKQKIAELTELQIKGTK